MKLKTYRLSLGIFLAFLLSFLSCPQDINALSKGEKAPDFTLIDTNGEKFTLSSVKGSPLTVLYFFDPASRASRTGIDLVLKARQKYPEWDIKVLAISEGSKAQSIAWQSEQGKGIIVLLDTGEVARIYDIPRILPVSFLLGPELQVLNQVSGGGRSGHKLLVRLAERELSRKKIKLAKSLARDAADKAPKDPEAKAVIGYAALKQGKIDEAQDVFQEVASIPEGKAIGVEGLAHVKFLQGKTQEAYRLAQEAQGRAGADTLRADILYAQGKTAEARSLYSSAAGEPAFSFHQWRPYDRLGRLAVAEKAFPEAIGYYDKALQVDPYAVEVLSNKGVAYSKEGKWDQAASIYRQVLQLSPGDRIALGLLRQAQDMLALAQDAQKAERIDRLIKELSERYKKGEYRTKGEKDQWTSRPLVLAFLPILERGFLTDRDGVAQAISLEIGQRLEESGRLRIVERALLDKLLAELNLGSSQLADPNTALRLGKVLAARLLAAGSLRLQPVASYLSLRLIDSETSAIPAVVSTNFTIDRFQSEVDEIAAKILAKIREKYPLRGYIVQVKNDTVILNLGKVHGLKQGTRLAVLAKGKPIEFMGRKLQPDLEQVGQIEITRVEKELSFGRILSAEVPVKKAMKVEEIVESKEKASL